MSHTKLKTKIFFSEFEIVARWCLWASALTTIATVTAGFYAYYSVKHDAISHAAMTVHRNWALPTGIAIFLIACWSVLRYIKQKQLTLVFVISLLIVQCSLLITALHGGELVYRHGIGVMSLPQAEEVGHEHHHSGMIIEHQNNSSTIPPSDAHEHTHHSHDHQ